MRNMIQVDQMELVPGREIQKIDVFFVVVFTIIPLQTVVRAVPTS